MIYQWLSAWEWILSTLLVILTLYYAYKAYRKQVEMSNIEEIREGLRDIGDISLSSNLKVKATLYKYKNPVLGRKYAEIEFKFYIGASSIIINGHPPPGWILTRPDWGYPEKVDISKIEYAESKRMNENGMIIRCSTIDPIKCKEVVNEVIKMMLEKPAS